MKRLILLFALSLAAHADPICLKKAAFIGKKVNSSTSQFSDAERVEVDFLKKKYNAQYAKISEFLDKGFSMDEIAALYRARAELVVTYGDPINRSEYGPSLTSLAKLMRLYQLEPDDELSTAVQSAVMKLRKRSQYGALKNPERADAANLEAFIRWSKKNRIFGYDINVALNVFRGKELLDDSDGPGTHQDYVSE